MKNNPLIFLHYGFTPYMYYTLSAAKLTNPKKKIILLGDEGNKKICTTIGIEHHNFDDYLYGEEIETFEKYYQRIGGEDFEKMNHSKGGKDWTKFNFLKWFVLKNFIDRKGIEKFWTFDTDTMIVENLTDKEEGFKHLDYTTINVFDMMQGFVNNLIFLDHFKDLILKSFKNRGYLQTLKNTEFKTNPNWGFTVMRLFKMLKEEYTPNILRISEPINKEIYDECICFTEDYNFYDKKINNYNLKKIYLDDDNKIYIFNTKDKAYYKLCTINLSWAPNFVFKQILKSLQTKNRASVMETIDYYKVLNVYPSLFEKISLLMDRIKWRIMQY